MKLSELGKKIDARLRGDDVEIKDISGIDFAGAGDITFVSNPKYLSKLKETKASAVIVGEGVATAIPALVSKNPYLSFAKAISVFRAPPPKIPPGIDALAVVRENAQISADAAVGAFSYISSGAKIGENTVIMPQVFVGEDVSIGDECFIYPNVTIREKVVLGNRVIIHSGSVIGSDGYGYVRAGATQRKIPQAGNVVLGDDVEIGSNVSIDRGTIDSTVIGKGTKIDNLVHIAHNVRIGENCLILGQTGMAGSTIVGNNTVLASQSGIAGHLRIGNNVVVAARGGVIKDVGDGEIVSGFPARKHSEMMKVYAAMMKLPEILAKMKK